MNRLDMRLKDLIEKTNEIDIGYKKRAFKVQDEMDEHKEMTNISIKRLSVDVHGMKQWMTEARKKQEEVMFT